MIVIRPAVHPHMINFRKTDKCHTSTTTTEAAVFAAAGSFIAARGVAQNRTTQSVLLCDCLKTSLVISVQEFVMRKLQAAVHTEITLVSLYFTVLRKEKISQNTQKIDTLQSA